MKNEKKNNLMHEPFLGYCPNNIVKKKICIAILVLYCDLKGLNDL